MNKGEKDILSNIFKTKYMNQRILAEQTGYSLGFVNCTIKKLIEEEYLNEEMNITKKTIKIFEDSQPKNAIILAAGYGLRMLPVNMETPKGLLEIEEEPLVERIIKQLQDVGITDIYIVVGFMKGKYEYLIDEYNVHLIVNEDYAMKNNIHSLKLVLNQLSNSYIIPCDIWCGRSPFSKNELYSWYMVSDLLDKESGVRINRKMELVSVPEEANGNTMIGIAYIMDKEANYIRQKIQEMGENVKYKDSFWEEALYKKNRMIVQAKLVHYKDFVEINTYEQLRELDENSNQLKLDAINVIKDVLKVEVNDIINIKVLKKGMTNRSFQFVCNGKKYIMRIPGVGTDKLINRVEEAEVYNTIANREISDEVVYINPLNGYKITEFLENARSCNPFNLEDVKKCITKLRSFHDMKLQVNHEFNIFEQINFYQSLWNGKPSVYKDYMKTKNKIFSLKPYIEKHIEKKVLIHIDSVPDNFLFTKRKDGKEDIRIIDWEYAGMQDPHVDVAMFCIYSLYNRKQINFFIDEYFLTKCKTEIRIKIYCYIAACGLLWSNWCEYKNNLGIEFGEYSLRQYRYAKEYYKIVKEELGLEEVE